MEICLNKPIKYTDEEALYYKPLFNIGFSMNFTIKLQFEFSRHGSNHDVYVRGSDIEQIPRHKEINEMLAKAILRKWGL